MVYFDCGSCGTGLKKQQVEKHLQQCRTNSFSCIDCGKDFYGRSYAEHIKCISEAEKYESKSYQAKANKGEVKQNAWFEKVVYAINNANPTPKTRLLLQKLQDYPNVPRKKAKFMNFVRNSFRSLGLNEYVIEETWNIIEKYTKSEPEPPVSQSKRQFEENEVEAETNKKQKTIENKEKTQQDSEKFDWFEAIKEIINEKSEINRKKLEKKVLKKYKKIQNTDNKNNNNNDDDDNNKLVKKFSKKLEKYSKFFTISKLDDNSENDLIKLKET